MKFHLFQHSIYYFHFPDISPLNFTPHHVLPVRYGEVL